ncbi:NUDIX domain-containing protein [Rhizobium sp. P28RR-XV]|uniref:NUDIX domain-containing protein n=1 Tax=Rhizobium sp. P28RR-XV TaxID=2726737 RepID=UPI0014567BE5|nr:NUDIX domain-containing protein [Rhizobium sp. P28RR-XV]NLR86121.1 NUDIX domain-containing protein [Rhizobium sp. P28RR-XV]
MVQKSAGILAYRVDRSELEVLLVHPGGPYWQKRDIGAWQIPKGELFDNEEADVAARREFAEETGWILEGALYPLGEIRQHGGKSVMAFASEGAFSVSTFISQT